MIASPVDERLVNDEKFEFWEKAQDKKFQLPRLNLKKKGTIQIGRP